MKSLVQEYNVDSQQAFDSQESESVAQNLMAAEIQELYRSKQRLKEFIRNLGSLRSTPLHQSVMEYYDRVSERAFTPENVLKMNEKRVQKMLKNKKIKKNWSNEDVHILIWVLSKYIEKSQIGKIDEMVIIDVIQNNSDWKCIADLIPGSSADRCMFKWLSLKKFNLATYRWEEAQSAILSKLVNDYGIKDWKCIAQRLYKLNADQNKIFRNAKQCREHWSCYLNPKLKKGPWEGHQDRRLLQCILSNNGHKKWSQIARKFHGRTENALKNRYNLIMQKQKKLSKNRDELTLIRQELARIGLCGGRFAGSEIKAEMQSVEVQIQQSYQNTKNKVIKKKKDVQPCSALDSSEQIFQQDYPKPLNKADHHLITQYPKQEPLTSTPPQPRIVKANYHQLINILMGNGDNECELQLVPAVMTGNNQFHINAVYTEGDGQCNGQRYW